MNVAKRRRISKYLTKEKAGIVCLQETYLHESENGFLACMFGGRVFLAPSRDQAWGVMLALGPLFHGFGIIRYWTRKAVMFSSKEN